MAPSHDDSSPPWRHGTPHDALNRFTSLLGTFSLKESNKNEQSSAEQALAPKHDGLVKLLENDAKDGSSLAFPSLLLKEEDHTGVDGLERSEVQAKAARSMAKVLTPSMIPSRAFRPTQNHVESVPEQNVSEADVACHNVSKPCQVPTAMLNNLAASFRLLVDARLRAYTSILARHGVSLAISPEVEHRQEAVEAVERKLENLLDIGSRISINNMVTSFQPQSKLGISRTCEDGTEEIMMPVLMSAVLDITIPDEDDFHERIAVSLQATGAIAGACEQGSPLLKAVTLELDTEQLMSAMVHKAAKVSSIALNHVNDSNCRHVTAAMQSIKHALPVKRKEPSFVATRNPPVVSPDQMAMLPLNRPTPLTLDDEEDEDGPELTAERCASIVDDCFGGITDDLMLSPPTKKMKMEDAPAVPPAVL